MKTNGVTSFDIRSNVYKDILWKSGNALVWFGWFDWVVTNKTKQNKNIFQIFYKYLKNILQMLTKNLTNKVETLSAIRLVWLSGHKYPDASQPLVPPLVFFWGHLLQTDLWQWKHYLTLLLRIFNLVPRLDLTFIVHVNCWISTPNLSYFIYCY